MSMAVAMAVAWRIRRAARRAIGRARRAVAGRYSNGRAPVSCGPCPWTSHGSASACRRVSRTRFAPAPTGLLHLGHVANAVMVWGVARALGGEVLLRIEDHDRPALHAGLRGRAARRPRLAGIRARRASARGVAGRPQPGPAARPRRRLPGPPWRGWRMPGCSSAAPARGAASRRPSRRGTPPAPRPSALELRYDGRCRGQGLPLDDGHGWRVRLAPGIETFDDARLGLQAQDPAAQCGDLLCATAPGNWTYQFAATVDDTCERIDLVDSRQGPARRPPAGRSGWPGSSAGRRRRSPAPPAAHEAGRRRS